MSKCFEEKKRKSTVLYTKIHSHKYCAGYTKSTTTLKTPQACYSWVKKVNPSSLYFNFREDGNFHCGVCSPTYNGGTNGLLVQTHHAGLATNINVW